MIARSYAKINLGIEVSGIRKDGFHEVKTLLQTIDLYDVLNFLPIEKDSIELVGDDVSISWGKDNLIYRAASLLKEKYKVSFGVRIKVKKNIPSGKGLGGGSSNAAISLFVLNELWGLKLSKSDLMGLGKILGSDIPFFLEGGACLGEGRGDEITPLNDMNLFFCLLTMPDFSIMTREVYKRFQFDLTSKEKDSKIIQFLNTKEAFFLENSLEEIVFSLFPQLKAIKCLIQSQGAELSLVTGTGSAVYGLFKDKKKAQDALKEVEKKYSSCVVKTLGREEYWRKVKVGV
ncbi:MAG: 4-(cytidine 5'-diphospho)-2-C-methyl-D-erythritol kinase [Candidatus Aminicenantaceae bacterium]